MIDLKTLNLISEIHVYRKQICLPVFYHTSNNVNTQSVRERLWSYLRL